MMWQAASLFTTSTWKDVSGGTAYYAGLTGVARAFGSTLYKADEAGRVSRSTDNGTTWTTQTLPVGDPTWDILQLVQVNATTAFLTTGNNNPYGGELYKTTNNGSTWVKLPIAPGSGTTVQNLAYNQVNGRLSLMLQPGSFAGSGTLRTTYSDDLGVTWSTLTTLQSMTDIMAQPAKKSAFDSINNRLYFVTLTGSTNTPNPHNVIYYTDDGATWSVLPSPKASTADRMSNLAYDNANSTLIATYDSASTIKYTSNGGTTWSTLNPALGNIADTVVSNNQFIIGTTSGVYRTTLPLTAGSVFANISPVGFSGGVNSISVNADGSGSLILGTQGNPGKVYITN